MLRQNHLAMFQKNIMPNSKFRLDKKSLKLSKFFLRLLIFICKIESHFEFSLQGKLSNSSGKMCAAVSTF